MTNADHDPIERDEVFKERLRGALDPRLAAGAAERIAEGAWQRAHGPKAPPTAPPVRRIPRRATRYAAAAALLLAIVAGGYVLRPATDAFAVEGAPVRVWKGSDWEASSRVRGDATVFAPEGTVALLGRDGSRIEPTPGAVFRIVPSKNAPFEVRIMRGSVSVSGGSHRIVVGDFEMQPETLSAHAILRAALISDEAFSGEAFTAEPPKAPPGVPADAVPQVEVVVGGAVVRHRVTGERRSLSQLDLLTLDVRSQRMLTVQPWNDRLATRAFLGAMPIDVSPTPRGDVQLLLHDADMERIATLVPHEEMQRAFALLNFATLENLRASPRTTIAVAIRDVGEHLTTLSALDPSHEVIHEKDGRTTSLRVFPGGSVEIQADGKTLMFSSLDAARKSAGDALAPFRDYLDELD